MPKIYKVRVSITAALGGANLDYGIRQFEVSLPEGKDDQTIEDAISEALNKLDPKGK